MYLYLVFNKSAYRSLLYIDIILFVKTIFDFEQFFYTDIRRMKPDIQYSPKLNIKKLYNSSLFSKHKSRKSTIHILVYYANMTTDNGFC